MSGQIRLQQTLLAMLANGLDSSRQGANVQSLHADAGGSQGEGIDAWAQTLERVAALSARCESLVAADAEAIRTASDVLTQADEAAEAQLESGLGGERR